MIFIAHKILDTFRDFLKRSAAISTEPHLNFIYKSGFIALMTLQTDACLCGKKINLTSVHTNNILGLVSNYFLNRHILRSF